MPLHFPWAYQPGRRRADHGTTQRLASPAGGFGANFRHAEGAFSRTNWIGGSFISGAALLMLLPAAALAAVVVAQASPPLPSVGVSHAELFIASFGPAGGEKALRTSELAMREQVRLAFYGIDATRLEVQRGRISAEEGEATIGSFQQTLRNFVHDHSNDALVAASAGQASDIPAIATLLGALLGVARQDALMGRDEVAVEAQGKMMNVLRTFSERFAATCDQQIFPAEVALGLARQNELLGTGIDVTHCARRRLSATITHRLVRYRWENCSIDGGGKWTITLAGFLSGEGSDNEVYVEGDGHGEGLFRVTTRVEGPTRHGRYDGVTDDWSLGLELRITGRSEAPASAATVPNDAGPNARPNGRLPAPVPRIRDLPRPVTVGTLRAEVIHVIWDGYMGTDWVESPIHLEERPCRP